MRCIPDVTEEPISKPSCSPARSLNRLAHGKSTDLFLERVEESRRSCERGWIGPFSGTSRVLQSREGYLCSACYPRFSPGSCYSSCRIPGSLAGSMFSLRMRRYASYFPLKKSRSRKTSHSVQVSVFGPGKIIVGDVSFRICGTVCPRDKNGAYGAFESQWWHL